jgi:ribosome biogenesis GTPase / thiamine phosphate phosphatase
MSYNLDHRDLLRQIGFNSLVGRARESLASVPGTLARVIERSRSTSVIHDGAESHEARSMPALSRLTPIVVGDWVLVACDTQGEWWISDRLTPYTEFHRIDPSGNRQALVTNVDGAFLVMGLDADFNLRRLERYLALAKSAGALPVVVLTKADLCTDVSMFLDLLSERLPSNIKRHAVNATDSVAVDCLSAHLGPGQTVVLLGSSGAGKSTLTNTLTRSFTQETGAVRTSDSRGRHTTTSRQLCQLPSGGCLIDTPGLRGLRLDIDRLSLDAAFDDIAALAEGCRFRDCAHHNEPGCAVRASVAPDRLANYHKLCREISRDRADPLARQTAKAEIKMRQRALRAMQKERGR